MLSLLLRMVRVECRCCAGRKADAPRVGCWRRRAGGVAFSLWFVTEDFNIARIRQVDKAAKG